MLPRAILDKINSLDIDEEWKKLIIEDRENTLTERIHVLEVGGVPFAGGGLRHTQIADILEFIGKHNSWGLTMNNHSHLKRVCVKYIDITWDSRTDSAFNFIFRIGGKEQVSFRIESDRDLQAMYNYLDDIVT